MHVYYNTVQGSIFTDSQIGLTYSKNAITLNHTIKNHPRVRDAIKFILMYSSAPPQKTSTLNQYSLAPLSYMFHMEESPTTTKGSSLNC